MNVSFEDIVPVRLYMRLDTLESVTEDVFKRLRTQQLLVSF